MSQTAPQNGPRPTRLKSDYLITNRRKNEDARNEMLETTAYYAKTGLQSQFEESTNLAIRRKKIEHRLDEFRAQEQANLEKRQTKLQGLFEQDNQAYRHSLEAQESTREQRVIAMRARVAELKGKRESERKELVEEKLMQLWRAECDELRKANSVILVKTVANARKAQLEEKKVYAVQALKEKQHYEVLWEQDRQKKILREERDRQHRQELNMDMIQMLGEQMALLKAQAAEESILKQEEAKLMKQIHTDLILEEERAHQSKIREQREMAQSLDKFNSIRLKQKQKDAREALEMDLKVLNEYLLQDEAEKQAKSAKRESLKREMQVYRDYLLEQKQIEKAREEEISRLYTIEDEKFWAKRAEKWQKEHLARDKLMKEVMAQRQEQVKNNLERNRLAQSQIHLEKEHLKADLARIKAEEKEAWEKHQIKAQKYCDELFAQMQSAKQMRLDEKQRDEEEDRVQLEISKKYDYILAQEMKKLMEL